MDGYRISKIGNTTELTWIELDSLSWLLAIHKSMLIDAREPRYTRDNSVYVLPPASTCQPWRDPETDGFQQTDIYTYIYIYIAAILDAVNRVHARRYKCCLTPRGKGGRGGGARR